MSFTVIAGSDSDEAIHVSANTELDCFAKPVIGRALPRPLVRNDGHLARGHHQFKFADAVKLRSTALLTSSVFARIP
jgi:hypothetical protein